MPTLDRSRYELIGEPLRGGMGQVWRAIDQRLGRPVAVKQIHPGALTTEGDKVEYAKRFRREARLTAQIRHPGVPQVFDAVIDEEDPSELYLVMEWVDGRPLDSFYGSDRPLPIEWATSIAAQIAAVLSHAHAVPAVHRDLKPGNVLLTAEGIVKVLDFGIAAILQSGVEPVTGPGPQPGTVHYMPPEQLRGVNVTPRSDLYALGCMLYEMLTGTPAFSGDTFEQIVIRQLETAPQAMHELREGIPEGLTRLTNQLLSKNPDDRPKDAEAVYNEIAPFLPQARTADRAGLIAEPEVPSDPTLMYRRPNAPKPQTQTSVPVPAESVVDAVWTRTDTLPDRREAREAVDHAGQLAMSLIEDDHPDQAVQVLEDAIARTIDTLGSDDKGIRDIRRARAHMLYESGDYRRALREFDALAETNERLKGLDDLHAVECRLLAARCRAALGLNTEALTGLRSLYQRVRSDGGDLSNLAIEIRQDIAMTLVASDEVRGGLDMLHSLAKDMRVIHRADDEQLHDVERLIERIRSTIG